MLYEYDKIRDENPVSDEDEISTTEFWDNLNLFIQYYPEYLYRKELSRFLVLDTSNVVIDIEVGADTTLETFKRAHRGIVVLKALEEQKKIELDNERHRRLLATGKLGDPEVDRLTIVRGDEDSDTIVVDTD